MFKSILLTVVLIAGFSWVQCEQRLVCYHEYWDHYRTSKGKFTVDDIEPSLCTHVVYSYMGIESNKMKILDPWLMVESKNLQKFTKRLGSKAKAMISIGGSSVGTNLWSAMAAYDESRGTFVQSVVAFLQKYQFDGVMIDWQWPGGAGGDSSDKENYVKLLSDLKSAFQSKSYVLGTTGPGFKEPFDAGIDAAKVAASVDFVHVLSYDYHGPWEKKTRHEAPLFHSTDKNPDGYPESGSASLNYWVRHGAPKDKLLLSVPAMGRTFRLAKEDENELGDDAVGAGTAGPYTQTPGFMSYLEVCILIKQAPSEWHFVRDNEAVGVYASKKSLWVTFDDSQTAKVKADYVQKNGFGGVVVAGIGNDDFHGDCSGKRFPVLYSVNQGLGRDPSITPPPVGSTVGPTKAPVFVCKKAGSFRDPSDCRKYHKCVINDLNVFEDTVSYCDKGMAFDDVSLTCKPKKEVKGCEND